MVFKTLTYLEIYETIRTFPYFYSGIPLMQEIYFLFAWWHIRVFGGKSRPHVRRVNLSQNETGDDTATYETLFAAAFTT